MSKSCKDCTHNKFDKKSQVGWVCKSTIACDSYNQWEPIVSLENSGGSCSYYKVLVNFTYDNRPPFVVECGEIIDALQMNQYEANAFKEIWRMASARQGREKAGNTETRGGEKIEWCGQMIKKRAKYYGS